MREDQDCSFDPCPCDGKPKLVVGTPDYIKRRYHVDAGDLCALKAMIHWMKFNQPFVHLRWADGELNSLCGVKWTNADGQNTECETLGAALSSVLFEAAFPALNHSVFFGVDWTGQPERLKYLSDRGYLDTIRWCPSQVFVNGLPSGVTMEFFRVVRNWKGNRFIVGNASVVNSVPGLECAPIAVSRNNAWGDYPIVRRKLLDLIRPGDLVLYAAGMTSNVLGWNLFRDVPGTTHIDIGCVLDGAAGIKSRGWQEHDDDPRWIAFQDRYIPFLKKTSPGMA